MACYAQEQILRLLDAGSAGNPPEQHPELNSQQDAYRKLDNISEGLLSSRNKFLKTMEHIYKKYGQEFDTDDIIDLNTGEIVFDTEDERDSAIDDIHDSMTPEIVFESFMNDPENTDAPGISSLYTYESIERLKKDNLEDGKASRVQIFAISGDLPSGCNHLNSGDGTKWEESYTGGADTSYITRSPKPTLLPIQVSDHEAPSLHMRQSVSSGLAKPSVPKLSHHRISERLSSPLGEVAIERIETTLTESSGSISEVGLGSTEELPTVKLAVTSSQRRRPGRPKKHGQSLIPQDAAASGDKSLRRIDMVETPFTKRTGKKQALSSELKWLRRNQHVGIQPSDGFSRIKERQLRSHRSTTATGGPRYSSGNHGCSPRSITNNQGSRPMMSANVVISETTKLNVAETCGVDGFECGQDFCMTCMI